MLEFRRVAVSLARTQVRNEFAMTSIGMALLGLVVVVVVVAQLPINKSNLSTEQPPSSTENRLPANVTTSARRERLTAGTQ